MFLWFVEPVTIFPLAGGSGRAWRTCGAEKRTHLRIMGEAKMKRLLVLGLLLVLASCLTIGLIGCKPPPTYGTVKFDNWTGYDIACYIDGEYQGTMADWSYLYAHNVVTGTHTLTATHGSLYWGPTTALIEENQTYDWNLYP
jgi:hypothetical protein